LSIFIYACSSINEFSEYENIDGKFIETGIASWYGPNFHGNKTANGEIFDMNKMTAAHRTLPFGSIVRIINKENNKSVIVRINDRGPFVKERIIDLSKKAADKINLIINGSANVEIFLLNIKDVKKLPNNLKIPHYSVQVGSFINELDAIQMSSKISGSIIEEVKINKKSYFRIYVGLFTEISEAQMLKNSLKTNGIEGFVKQIDN